MRKPIILISTGLILVIVIIGILYLTGIFSPQPLIQNTADRGIAITPKSGKAFLNDPDIERWAVIVGISDYRNNPQITDLKYADRDAQSFYDFLISPQGGCFKRDNIQLLLNEKATVSNLRYALGTFLGKTADTDLVVIFMAGHGTPDPKKWENLYFLTYDANPDSLPNTAYPMWEMETALQRFIKAKRVIVVTDACHSAALSGGMIAMRGQDGYRVNEYIQKLAESREGCTFITASRAGEGSQESEKWGSGHGVFTYFLLEGLQGKADRNKDGFITVKEAYDYLYPKVQRESENGQTPFAGAYLDNSIPVGICNPETTGLTANLSTSSIQDVIPAKAGIQGSHKEIKGMTFIDNNQQGYKEYRHEATGMVFVLVPAGTFRMGSNDGEADEKPVHEIRVDSFLISKYETTQGVWQKIMNNNPSNFKKGDNYPVELVSWDDCQEFCRKTGLRLPTEAEWEYACRTGTNTRFYWGDQENGDYMWYNNNSGGTTHPVGQKKPNGFGLYDMSGNVWEWCSDWYGDTYYQSSHKDNPKGAASGQGRVLRGGSWNFSANHCRSASRLRYEPANRSGVIGVRCVLSK